MAAVVGAVMLGFSGPDAADQLTGAGLVVDVVLGSLCCLMLWWRRRWPLGVALAALLVGGLSTSATAAQLLAL
ncbi:MAG: sensor histidine kinase, partial [Acidimicrobiales bacterium]